MLCTPGAVVYTRRPNTHITEAGDKWGSGAESENTISSADQRGVSQGSANNLSRAQKNVHVSSHTSTHNPSHAYK